MKKLSLEAVEKRRGGHIILSGLTYNFSPPRNYGITGRNGSGKSTLLQLASTFLEPSKGICCFYDFDRKVPDEKVHQLFSVAAPYLPLVKEFTVKEHLHFSGELQPWMQGLSIGDLLEILNFESFANHQLDKLSSGMIQRVKVISALATDCSFVFLDEPTTNFDENAKAWFHEQLSNFGRDKCVIIASNDNSDLSSCDEILSLHDYKRK